MPFKYSTFILHVLLLSFLVLGICSVFESALVFDAVISTAFFSANIFVWFFLVKRAVSAAVLNQGRPALGIFFFMKKISLLLCLGGMITLMPLSSIIMGLLIVVLALLLSGLPFGLIQEFSNGR
ncbi:MAG: hypothetical protein VX278_21245 [Myxococcota bacterium]|nr:hypothetical protein [Myxococcota bacterium]